MIEKPTIVITSLGRTGTEFFSKFFRSIIPDCTSLHEPDTFALQTGTKNRFEEYLQQIRQAGVWRMVFLKALGMWSLAKLSDSRLIGALDDRRAADGLRTQRRGFISRQPGSVYVEANLGYYGLLDVLPSVFRHHRAIYIVRDGRDWIRSEMNWGELYGERGARKYFSHRWPTATDFPTDPHAKDWDTLSQFEKLCWAWPKLNGYALEGAAKNPDTRVFHFEKIFSGEDRYACLRELVDFAVSLPGLAPERLGSLDGWLERKSHQSTDGFPAWENWSVDQKRIFERSCAPFMEKLGYTLA